MAQYTPEKTQRLSTGNDNPQDHLLPLLKNAFKEALAIDINVSFIMESGIRMLMDDLKEAARRNVPIRILCGNYLGITQPTALMMIKRTLEDQVDLRLYNDPHRSFHPKAYKFVYADHTELFIGSSNLSASALTSGIEWNYAISSRLDPASIHQFEETFQDLFENQAIALDLKEIIHMAQNWRKPRFSGYPRRPDLIPSQPVKIEPRGAQIEALYALRDLRSQNGRKGLVQAATGVGKTYLAAFDSQDFQKILFVAHREEILKQAAESFAKVRPELKQGFFQGGKKETEADIIFASVMTLGRPEYLKEEIFPPDYFDYIIIDECHHAVARMYKNLLEYFQPRFLLGLTATPERMDGRSIYEICDYNVAYEIDLEHAINQGLLSPFRYYGIYDDTDYSQLVFQRGKYREEDLEKLYELNTARNELIISHYLKYPSRKALGFCASINHAKAMAEAFCAHGIAAKALYNGSAVSRDQAIEDLESGKIQVLFSVNILNEGVDIPAVDLVLFLRPTQSPTVFLQQLGRGLRLAEDKEYLVVLDFIGNYKTMGFLPGALSGLTRQNLAAHTVLDTVRTLQLPAECQLELDMKLIHLFEKMRQNMLRIGRTSQIQQSIREEFERIKNELNHSPSRLELYQNMNPEIYDLCLKKPALNPFRSYRSFLQSIGETIPSFSEEGDRFLKLIEQTNMVKVYKMPVLLTFWKKDHMAMAVTENDLLEKWREFFETGVNWQDLHGGLNDYSEYKNISDKAHLKNILSNPVHFLIQSGQGYFASDPDHSIRLHSCLEQDAQKAEFAAEFKDILDYRIQDYYSRRYKTRKKA